jgi:hypothetical protein
MNTAPSNPTYKWNPNLPTGTEPTVADEKKDEVGTGADNFCIQEVMSMCGVVGEKWKDHKACKFSIKATNANRCMFRVMDDICDCLKAQLDSHRRYAKAETNNIKTTF